MNTMDDLLRRARALLLPVLVSVGALSLAACNTVAGIGEDMESAGDAIEDKAEKEKRY